MTQGNPEGIRGAVGVLDSWRWMVSHDEPQNSVLRGLSSIDQKRNDGLPARWERPTSLVIKPAYSEASPMEWAGVWGMNWEGSVMNLRFTIGVLRVAWCVSNGAYGRWPVAESFLLAFAGTELTVLAQSMRRLL